MNFLCNVFDRKLLDSKNIYFSSKSFVALFLYNKLAQENKDIVFVMSNLYETSKIYNEIREYTKQACLYPMDDFLTFVTAISSPELEIERMITLKNITTNSSPKVIFTDIFGLIKDSTSLKEYQSKILELSENMTISRESLLAKLSCLGYQRVSLVNKTGDYAVRGYIIDVYLLDYENPVRIEFFDDEIESIRFFDVNNQLSIEKAEKVMVYPLVLEKSSDNLADYFLDKNIIIFDKEAIMTSYEKLVNDNFNLNNNASVFGDNFEKIMDKAILLNSYNNNSTTVDIEKIDEYNGNLEKLIADIIKYRNYNYTIIISIGDKEYKNIKDFFEELDLVFTKIDNIFIGKINIINTIIPNSFKYNDYIVINQNTIFGTYKKAINYNGNLKIGTKIKNIDSIEKGDYVIHINNGIGRYDGIISLRVAGVLKDYLKIDYAGDDKLYIPVEKIEIISKYADKNSEMPLLHRLGSTTWQRTKTNLQKKLENIAQDLLKVSAVREKELGFACGEDTKEQYLFENEFKYQLTLDQKKAVSEVKADMENKMPMDRLICGDVGYGKTEVAFRAMFKSVSNFKQVIYLCPTTILSNQQYKAALERFEKFPIRIELLNRFVSYAKTKQIMADLEEGKVDIIIGTHKLLNSQIKCRDLGLLVIDEEQRFGVKQKEKIKQKYNKVDVLTLSATPIPRTLQMSLSGVRTMSLIETPPNDRYPITTYLTSENDLILRDAIYKEMSRNGQVFILYNRVEFIENKTKQIKELVPEARITFAHGQMDKKILEKTMNQFINGEYDILICSTIIEIGIDIPNANTLIILDSDHLGLGQLYQIRGRVGRSNRIAYCYLMYSKQVLNEIATKRLETIKDFTKLGSGYQIAKRDLSIRGAGDILGQEQSGFIASVGIELYMKLLDETIRRLKGEEIELEKDDKPLLTVDTHIDESYDEDEKIKIAIHKLINTVSDEASFDAVKKQIIDRFGKIDERLTNYMYEEWFEKEARNLKINKVINRDKEVSVFLPIELSSKVNGEELFYYLYNLDPKLKLKYEKDMFEIIALKENKWIYNLILILKQLKDL